MPFSFNQLGRTKKHNIFTDQNYYEDHQDDYESFQTIELRFNYNHKNKWNFLAILPYRYNNNHFEKVYPPIGQVFDSTTVTQGFGDIILGAQRLSIYETAIWRHQFKYGIGLSLPTGYSQLRASSDAPLNDPSHLPGKGATDLMLRLNYTGSKDDKLGFKANAIYAFSLKKAANASISNQPLQVGIESYNYRFGNRFALDGLVFYVIGKSQMKFIPKTGYSFNYVDNDQLNAESLEDTGGFINYANVGFDLVFGKFTWQNMFSLPFQQTANGTQIENTGKFQTGILFSLKTQE